MDRSEGGDGNGEGGGAVERIAEVPLDDSVAGGGGDDRDGAGTMNHQGEGRGASSPPPLPDPGQQEQQEGGGGEEEESGERRQQGDDDGASPPPDCHSVPSAANNAAGTATASTAAAAATAGQQRTEKSADGNDNSGDDNDEDNDEDNDSSGSSSDSSSDDDDDDDSSSSSEDEGAANKKRRIVKDGHELSEYEILRLERIERNREYLANLGLEGKNGAAQGGFLGERPKPRRKKNKPKPPPPTAASRPSRRAKESVDYTEPRGRIAAWAAKVEAKKASKQQQQDGDTDNDEKKQEPTAAAAATATAATATTDAAEGNQKESRKRKKHKERMEKFIYVEYKSLRSHKNRVLKQAERDVRLAEKAVKYWGRAAKKAENQLKRKEHREEEARSAMARAAEWKKGHLIGGSIKRLLRDADERMPELLRAAQRYDAEMEEKAKGEEREAKRSEADNKMMTLSALEWFPKALKGTESLLDSVLLERAPDDPPPPRRSRRSTQDTGSPEQITNPKSSKKKEATTENSSSDDWGDIPSDLISSRSSDENDRLRDVGGWVSPNFAELIDRSWPERDAPPEKFDVRTYVPQAGDCVLYYPAGHKEFLRHFPDELGKKTGCPKRIPLWERVATAHDNSRSQSWFMEEWRASVENDTANYPILCRVLSSLPEFPPDPYSKVVKKIGDGGEEKILWKAPSDPAAVQKIRGTPLRLAVELQPLTPVIPPKDEPESTGDPSLPLPPTFGVVTFPSQLKPFVVPFSWAYAASYSFPLSLGQKVTLKSDGATVKVKELASDAAESPTSPLEDKVDAIETLVSAFERSISKFQFLEEALADAPRDFPLRDGRVVVDTLRRFWKNRGSLKASKPAVSASTRTMWHFVQRTLPLWDGVSVMRNAYDRKVCRFSLWDLVPNTKGKDVSPAGFLPAISTLDESLRIKLDCLITDFSEENPEGDTFYYDVEDDVAPSYRCAVPIGMSTEKILRRLRRPSKKRSCYYRGAESILSDICLILENCQLYNSPDSPLVESALRVVGKLKGAVLRVARCHYQELQKSKKATEERRLLVTGPTRSTLSDQDEVDANGENRPPVDLAQGTNFLMHRFIGTEVDQDWLQPTKSIGSELADGAWVPQTGDKVLYSREIHSVFVKSHHPALEQSQSIIPPTLGSTPTRGSRAADTDDSSWVSGTVVWTRAAFPASSSTTFRTNASILVLGVRFGTQAENVTVLYWRPCLVPCDPSTVTSCPTCGFSRGSSFLRPDSADDPAGERSPLTPRLTSIDTCISLLKRRCIREEPIACLDPNLTTANVKEGYVVPSARAGLKTLPSFEDVLVRSNSSALQQAQVGTRGLSATRELDCAAPSLVQAGFLPPWLSISIAASAKKLLIHETVSPWAKLSLELILLRIRNGYYRHISAIENDILEAYITSAVLLLSEAASRKKAPVSLKRIAKSIAKPGDIEHVVSDSQDQLVVKEECEWAERIRGVRDLHSMVLLSVAEPSRMALLLGLQPLRPWNQNPKDLSSDEDPIRADSRHAIDLLSAALGKDYLLNTFRSSGTLESAIQPAPQIKIKIKCDGALVSCPRYFRREDHVLLAEREGKTVKVKTICGGKTISKLKAVSESELPYPNGIDSESPIANAKPVRVKVICNNMSISSGKQISAVAAVSGVLGDKSVTRVVDDCLSLKKADYEASDTLVRFLFGRPGRMNPCARCQAANKRSLFYCRVRHAHSNADFDWTSTFKDRRGVDGILQALYPGEQAKSDVTNEVEGGALDREELERTTEQQAGIEGSKDETTQEDKHTESVEFAEKAKAAHSLATNLLKEAQDYAKAPLRFSKEFVSTAFPFDPSDGHYIYCIICGLSGDLLCCDSIGCANVVHSHCVGLAEVPEDDWFCEECVGAGAKSSVGGPAGSESASQMIAVNRVLAVSGSVSDGVPKHLPFGRMEFDEEKGRELTILLEELNTARPEYHRLSTARFDGGGGDISAAPSLQEKKKLGRPRKDAPPADDVSDEDENENDSVSSEVEATEAKGKRKRGRPRKRAPQVEVEEASGLEESDAEPKKRSKKRRKPGRPAKRVPPEPPESSDDEEIIMVADNGSTKRRRRRNHPTVDESRKATGRESSSAVLSVERGHNVFKAKSRRARATKAEQPVARAPGKRASRPPMSYKPPNSPS